jgi:hypothetical protein
LSLPTSSTPRLPIAIGAHTRIARCRSGRRIDRVRRNSTGDPELGLRSGAEHQDDQASKKGSDLSSPRALLSTHILRNFRGRRNRGFVLAKTANKTVNAESWAFFCCST